jgi:hypothetical protein
MNLSDVESVIRLNNFIEKLGDDLEQIETLTGNSEHYLNAK